MFRQVTAYRLDSSCFSLSVMHRKLDSMVSWTQTVNNVQYLQTFFTEFETDDDCYISILTH